MKETMNFKLNKPENTDIVDITKLNENMDILDTQVYTNKTDILTLKTDIGDKTTLTTDFKTNLVGAINEHEAQINYLDALKVTPHLAKLVTDIDGVHGIKIESGIFTPALCASTTAGTHAYTIQTGRYNKIGKQVLATLDVTLTKDATMSGIIQINGLPFVSRAGPRYAINLLYFIGINMPTSTQLTGYVEAGTGNIIFYYQKSDGTNSQISSDKILSNFAIGITVMYETN